MWLYTTQQLIESYWALCYPEIFCALIVSNRIDTMSSHQRFTFCPQETNLPIMYCLSEEKVIPKIHEKQTIVLVSATICILHTPIIEITAHMKKAFISKTACGSTPITNKIVYHFMVCFICQTANDGTYGWKNKIQVGIQPEKLRDSSNTTIPN